MALTAEANPFPTFVLVGPTASGKSELAMALACYGKENKTPEYTSNHQNPKSNDAPHIEIDIEIVVADSMQVYRGMDIGTAKPTLKDRQKVRHHCLDLMDTDEDFSVELYKRAANLALKNIGDKGTGTPSETQPETLSNPRAIVVGGTGLYIRAVVDDFQIPPQYPRIVEELDSQQDTTILWERLNALDPEAAKTMLPNNRRRILRALEVTLGSGKPFSSFGADLTSYGETDFLQVGIRLPREVLDNRIDARYEIQMENGFLQEVKELSQKPLSKTARQALGYKEILEHLQGEMSLDEALDAAKRRTKKFARRQERWFRRDPRIQWIDVDDPKDALEDLSKIFETQAQLNPSRSPVGS